MNSLIAIFIGSGLGGIVRFGISKLVFRFAPNFPLGTLIVNIIACFMVGLLIQFFREKNHNEILSYLFVVGFCGGFSTFSTFGFETLELFRQQQYGFAFANVALSVVLCIVFTFLGIIFAKNF